MSEKLDILEKIIDTQQEEEKSFTEIFSTPYEAGDIDDFEQILIEIRKNSRFRITELEE
ncbi:hypothetical protein [Mannheimia indoligenes]|uniref:hypothetical protein n=1 Tax=Mannheimia indoligenes TaxID=3103145 RepID=UPI002FE5C852